MLAKFICLKIALAVSPIFITNVGKNGIDDHISQYLCEELVKPIFLPTWSLYYESIKAVLQKQKKSFEHRDLLQNGIKNILKKIDKHLLHHNIQFFSSDIELDNMSTHIAGRFRRYLIKNGKCIGEDTENRIDLIEAVLLEKNLQDFLCLAVIWEYRHVLGPQNKDQILDFYVKYMLIKGQISKDILLDLIDSPWIDPIDINSPGYILEDLGLVKRHLVKGGYGRFVFVYVISHLNVILQEVSEVWNEFTDNDVDNIQNIYECLISVKNNILMKIDECLSFQKKMFRFDFLPYENSFFIFARHYEYWNFDEWTHSTHFNLLTKKGGEKSKLRFVINSFIESTYTLLDSYISNYWKLNQNLYKLYTSDFKIEDVESIQMMDRFQKIKDAFKLEIEITKTKILGFFDADLAVSNLRVYKLFRQYTLEMLSKQNEANSVYGDLFNEYPDENISLDINLSAINMAQNPYNLSSTGLNAAEADTSMFKNTVSVESHTDQLSLDPLIRNLHWKNRLQDESHGFKKFYTDDLENYPGHYVVENARVELNDNNADNFCSCAFDKVTAFKISGAGPADEKMPSFDRNSTKHQKHRQMCENPGRISKKSTTFPNKTDRVDNHMAKLPFSADQTANYLNNIENMYLMLDAFEKKRDILREEIVKFLNSPTILTISEETALERIYERVEMCSYECNKFKYELKGIKRFLNSCLKNQPGTDPNFIQQASVHHDEKLTQNQDVENTTQIQATSTCSYISSGNLKDICFLCLIELWFDDCKCFDIRFLDAMIEFFDVNFTSSDIKDNHKRIQCPKNEILFFSEIEPSKDFDELNDPQNNTDTLDSKMSLLIRIVARKKIESMACLKENTHKKSDIIIEPNIKAEKKFISLISVSQLFTQGPSLFAGTKPPKYEENRIASHYFEIIEEISKFTEHKDFSFDKKKDRNESIYRKMIFKSANNEREKTFFLDVFNIMDNLVMNRNYIETENAKKKLEKMQKSVNLIDLVPKIYDMLYILKWKGYPSERDKIDKNDLKDGICKTHLLKSFFEAYIRVLNCGQSKIAIICSFTQSIFDNMHILSLHLDIPDIQRSLSKINNELDEVLSFSCSSKKQRRTIPSKDSLGRPRRPFNFEKRENLYDKTSSKTRSVDEQSSKSQISKSKTPNYLDSEIKQIYKDQIPVKKSLDGNSIKSQNDELKSRKRALKKARQKENREKLRNEKIDVMSFDGSDILLDQAPETGFGLSLVRNSAQLYSESCSKGLAAAKDSENDSDVVSGRFSPLVNISACENLHAKKSTSSRSYIADGAVCSNDITSKVWFEQSNTHVPCSDQKTNISSFSYDKILTTSKNICTADSRNNIGEDQINRNVKKLTAKKSKIQKNSILATTEIGTEPSTTFKNERRSSPVSCMRDQSHTDTPDPLIIRDLSLSNKPKELLIYDQNCKNPTPENPFQELKTKSRQKYKYSLSKIPNTLDNSTSPAQTTHKTNTKLIQTQICDFKPYNLSYENTKSSVELTQGSNRNTKRSCRKLELGLPLQINTGYSKSSFTITDKPSHDSSSKICSSIECSTNMHQNHTKVVSSSYYSAFTSQEGDENIYPEFDAENDKRGHNLFSSESQHKSNHRNSVNVKSRSNSPNEFQKPKSIGDDYDEPIKASKKYSEALKKVPLCIYLAKKPSNIFRSKNLLRDQKGRNPNQSDFQHRTSITTFKSHVKNKIADTSKRDLKKYTEPIKSENIYKNSFDVNSSHKSLDSISLMGTYFNQNPIRSNQYDESENEFILASAHPIKHFSDEQSQNPICDSLKAVFINQSEKNYLLKITSQLNPYCDGYDPFSSKVFARFTDFDLSIPSRNGLDRNQRCLFYSRGNQIIQKSCNTKGQKIKSRFPILSFDPPHYVDEASDPQFIKEELKNLHILTQNCVERELSTPFYDSAKKSFSYNFNNFLKDQYWASSECIQLTLPKNDVQHNSQDKITIDKFQKLEIDHSCDSNLNLQTRQGETKTAGPETTGFIYCGPKQRKSDVMVCIQPKKKSIIPQRETKDGYLESVGLHISTNPFEFDKNFSQQENIDMRSFEISRLYNELCKPETSRGTTFLEKCALLQHIRE